MLKPLIQVPHVETRILGHYEADVRQGQKDKGHQPVSGQIQTDLCNKLFKD